ncbi:MULTISPECIES: 50S ribosomal protein L23 [Caproicibacterium]|jgi:large subunit ribosomal protein L23|uniref:Large ribosomal subunit protein uL23 n=1 Tax=Caproicibacterium lactatifermentans TaxID=2666138 RepID=A0A859DT26_9FIRM|nr:50S ribosomal protein L23 [Caproicibacterium lactatifermentans]ARP50959.1 50S ribosomal protein L23 [Ruminococcaceae bacterium CPB6]MDD4807638.1 50S ribosomal protein L23 [Oscillospiraceae bacterium]QKN23313.1 50S ribosomal protein L23 [Caproicibacterium lactatifermentans]QKO30006.1 50S ribosomal protein L23 [Caproicibacterium lactatifermentans]
MTAHEIILRPVISEKAMSGVANKAYTFQVAPRATKLDIKNAVEELFGVKVRKVNTLHVRGHLRRQGRNQGYTPAWKKAIVSLTEDSKSIEFFDGML